MDEKNPLSLLKTVREELQTVQQQVDYLVAVLESQTRDGLDGITGPARDKKPLNLDVINRALQQMASKESQEEILEVLLSRTAECAERVILFDAENGKLRAWKGLGFTTELVSNVTVTQADSPLAAASHTGQVMFGHEGLEENLPWLISLGPLPSMWVCVPLKFGSYVPLVLYADSSTDLDAASLELLSQLSVLHMQNHYLAHLLQEGEEGTIDSSTGEEELPEVKAAQPPTGQEDGGEIGQEPETFEQGVIAKRTTLEPASLTVEEEEAAHGEARRLARLLVAEIRLYNEEDVEEGRRCADLFRRLRTDIERSRKMYQKLVHPMIQSQTDYYGAEIVRVLAQNDPDLMGSDYEEPEVSMPINPGSD
jgi:hypothetical protein